jgi:transcription-repair coupling factor (superfamily II helicase)
MHEEELERAMLRFLRREADVLVCTTIIESGIDIPSVNTILIDNADMFGLADLHQLRGRVGRYKVQARCLLLLPADRPIVPQAKKRLKAVEEFSELGAGFKIALRDLEIRGAGNLLGAEQSGHIAAVGFDLYSRLLEQAVKTMKAQLVAANYRAASDGDKETGRLGDKETRQRGDCCHRQAGASSSVRQWRLPPSPSSRSSSPKDSSACTVSCPK